MCTPASAQGSRPTANHLTVVSCRASSRCPPALLDDSCLQPHTHQSFPHRWCMQTHRTCAACKHMQPARELHANTSRRLVGSRSLWTRLNMSLLLQPQPVFLRMLLVDWMAEFVRGCAAALRAVPRGKAALFIGGEALQEAGEWPSAGKGTERKAGRGRLTPTSGCISVHDPCTGWFGCKARLCTCLRRRTCLRRSCGQADKSLVQLLTKQAILRSPLNLLQPNW